MNFKSSTPFLFAYIVFIVTYFGITSLSWAGNGSSSNFGFYSENDKLVPPSVQAVTKSVFEIYILNPTPQATLNLKAYDSQGFSVEEAYKKTKASDQVKTILLTQLKYCRDHNFLDSCDIYGPDGKGSGFLINDGHTLWTDSLPSGSELSVRT